MFNLFVISNEFIYADCLSAAQEVIFSDGMKLVFKRHIDWWDAEFSFALYNADELCVARYSVDGAVNQITHEYAVRQAMAVFHTYWKYIELAHI